MDTRLSGGPGSNVGHMALLYHGVVRSTPALLLLVVAVLSGCKTSPGEGEGPYEQDCVDWYMSHRQYTEDYSADLCRGLYVQYGGNGGWRNSPSVNP